MKTIIQALMCVCLIPTVNAYAQSSYMATYNSDKVTGSKNNSGISYENSVTDVEYEYEGEKNKKRINIEDQSEYEYEDGTVKNKIKYVSKNKTKKKKKPVKKFLKLSLEEKSKYGFKSPSKFFDLSDWSLSVPEDMDGNNKADNIEEKELSSGFKNDYFYATNDGAMVFTCPIGGFKSSTNTIYTRVELREMLRKGNTSIKTKGANKNNWVLKSSRSAKIAGGYNGQLKATLAVNHVTTTGNNSQVGRVIIGQIHATDDEPLRLYYRKLPNNKKGSIYFAHESKKDEKYYELIGSKSSTTKNPINGIELNEKFSYVVNVMGNELTVKILRPGIPVVSKTINIKKSGYKDKNEYMYFKAGVYNQNRSGDPEDYAKATFYKLSNSHSSY